MVASFKGVDKQSKQDLENIAEENGLYVLNLFHSDEVDVLDHPNLKDLDIIGLAKYVKAKNADALLIRDKDFFKNTKEMKYVINDLTDNSYEEELVEDLIGVIHYSSMKRYSQRRMFNKLKKNAESEILIKN